MENRSSSLFIWLIVGLAAFVLFRHSEVGRAAPDFALHGAYGGEYRLDSFRGKPVLLVFWGTHCSICRHELPILDGMRAEARQNGVEIACVNIGDADGAREVMRPYRLLNLVDPDGSAARSYGVSGIPKLVLIGADGKIRRSTSGYESEDSLRSMFR